MSVGLGNLIKNRICCSASSILRQTCRSQLSRNNFSLYLSKASIDHGRFYSNPVSPSNLNGVSSRNLYTESSLEIHSYEYVKNNISKAFESGKERYIERLSEYVKKGDNNSILKEDLMNMIAFAENEQHLNLVEEIVLQKYGQENLVSGSLGAALMRVYYQLNEVDRAYNNIKNESFGDFFNNLICHKIIMTMLFNAGRYDDVIEIYNISCNRLESQKKRRDSIRPLSVIVFASYAKINTREALEKAMELYKEDSGNTTLKTRVLAYLSYLALNQGEPGIALDFLTDQPIKNLVVSIEIKALALINLNRFEDVLYHLRRCVHLVDREKPLLTRATYDVIMEKLANLSDKEQAQELAETLNEVKDKNLLSDQSLDDLVFSKINRVKSQEENRKPPIGGYQYENRRNVYNQNRQQDQFQGRYRSRGSSHDWWRDNKSN